MSLSTISIKRPIATIVFVTLPFVIGFYSLQLMPIDLFPEIDFPMLVVETRYEGVAPAEIETLITKPIEEAVASVEDLDEMRSISQEGVSQVMLQFNFGTDMDFASLHVREKLDLAMDRLPDDSDDPILIRWDPSAFPVIQLNVSGDNLDRVKRYCEDIIKPRLESIPDVSSVSVQGGLEREIRIELDWEKLRALSLSSNDVINAVREENLNKPAGKIDEGRMDYLVRTVGEFKTIQEVENVIVAVRDGTPIQIKDIAEVKDDFAEVFTVSRMSLKPSVSMQAFKVSGGNSVRAAEAVKAELAAMEKQLPPDMDIGISMDFSPMIKEAIVTVKENAYIGAILAAIVLLLFLSSWRSTLIILVAIPTSVVSTFFCMYLADMSLNLISLGGLALGVGMVIDNSIVVIENIFRHRKLNPELDARDIAGNAAGELGLALTASTFTTLAVFFPIVFVEGIAGEIFKDLALVVVFSIAASLIVALTVVPSLGARLIAGGEESENIIGKGINKFLLLLGTVSGTLGRPFNKAYEVLIRLMTFNTFTRLLTVAGVLAVVVVVFMFMMPSQSQFPKMDQGLFSIEVEMPQGANLDYADRITYEVEKIATEVPEATIVSSNIRGNKGTIFISLGNVEDRERSIWSVMDHLRAETEAANIPEADISVQEMSHGGGGTEKPVQVEIVGNDYEKLERFALLVKERMLKVDRVWDVETSFDRGKPEIQIIIDRDRAADLGLTARRIAETIETYMAGTVAGQFRVGGDEYDIRVRLQKPQREFVADLEKIQVSNFRGQLIPISEVTRLYPTTGPVSLQRDQQMRLVSVTAQADRDKLQLANQAVEKRIEDLRPPAGSFVQYGGDFEAMNEAFAQLGLALVFAIFLVFLILAAQFESFSQPIIIMTTVPLSMVGVFFLLTLVDVSLSIPAYVGIIMLTGIVVNNAILLVDYINVLRGRGLDLRPAAVQAGSVRLRPVMMTTLTTILGMAPMALGLGSGAEFYQPLAMAVMGGLAASTFFTLLLTPVLYILLAQFTCFMGKVPAFIMKPLKR